MAVSLGLQGTLVTGMKTEPVITPSVFKYTTLLTFYFNFDDQYLLNKLVN
jgi:hypothetical protein